MLYSFDSRNPQRWRFHFEKYPAVESESDQTTNHDWFQVRMDLIGPDLERVERKDPNLPVFAESDVVAD